MAKIDPYKFVETDKKALSVRPYFAGVYYKDGYLYATDAHIALKMRSDYPKSYEGKIIKKDGTEIKGKYPNINSVIPDMSKMEPYYIDDMLRLSHYLDKVKKPRKSGAEIAGKIIFYPHGSNLKFNNSSTYYGNGRFEKPEGFFALDAWLFKKAIFPYMEKEGIMWLYANKQNSDSRAIVAKGQNGLALIMPVMANDGGEINFHPDEDFIVRTYSERKKQQTKNNTTMKKSPVKRTAKAKKHTVTAVRSRKSASAKTNTVKKARKILESQKKEYQRMFISETKKGGNTKAAAKRAGSAYRSKYGTTATTRWKNALRKAK